MSYILIHKPLLGSEIINVLHSVVFWKTRGIQAQLAFEFFPSKNHIMDIKNQALSQFFSPNFLALQSTLNRKSFVFRVQGN